MFIELTDHLRCPAPHDEAYLVLIPDVMRGRSVLQGSLGCPVCQRVYPITDAVPQFGTVEPAPEGEVPLPPAEAVHAFLGIEGPGGFVALVGAAGGLAPALGMELPGVHLVAVNPPAGVSPSATVSVIRSPRVPLKSRSCRGLVLGLPEAADPAWHEALGVVLPGLRATGQGPTPLRDHFEVLGSAEGWWVGRVG
jgi:uncharacterized protein YbaR (Trm112 family)